MSKASGTSQTPKRFQGRCAGCGREVRADRKGHLWATAPNDGSPLWCYDPAIPFTERGPFKAHAAGVSP
jgi:hypothetical protein